MSSSGDSVMPPLLHYWARLQVQTGSPFSDLWTGLGPGVPQVLNTWCHPGIIILWGLPRNWVRQVECTQGFQFHCDCWSHMHNHSKGNLRAGKELIDEEAKVRGS